MPFAFSHTHSKSINANILDNIHMLIVSVLVKGLYN